ncbi:hypothetical protein [Streptomyces liliifuscus]|uniref:TIR domain-containing protein n=1 Tax=Streptomyces liliifuscus TaxID=2797636 RepID=A0A7T7I2N7_9ACTN|nr:hypothetical protein [Streptomyces liliifuscus]QQM39886.1 hypothetical protein JEQ17_10680 [Streptomyces liliifuscus]
MKTSETDVARVFLGAPSILTPDQQTKLEEWVSWLEWQSFQVIRLGRDSHGENPWHTLTQLLAQVDGVVLLGFRQLDARHSVWRPETKEEALSSSWWTSPWLQLEAGMSVALALPVIVAAEADVKEGAFNPEVWNGQVKGVELSTPGAATDEWLDAVRERHDRRAGVSG